VSLRREGHGTSIVRRAAACIDERSRATDHDPNTLADDPGRLSGTIFVPSRCGGCEIEYSQYCPIAVAAETIADRWSLLILRDLMGAGRGFNSLHRCLPRMSRSMLSERLRRLETAGLVARTEGAPGRAGEYTLTPAGAELEPLFIALGEWSVRWLFGDPSPGQLDPGMLAFRMAETVDAAQIPRRRTVVELRCRKPTERHWVVLDGDGATACSIDPGYPVDVVVTGDTAELQRWFIGRQAFADALERGSITIAGPSAIETDFPRWFGPATPWHESIGRLAAH
jgi:DNA-binding HxlR family transcriptional regulator